MKKLPVYGIKEFDSAHHEQMLYANDLRTHLIDHQFVNNHHKHSTYVCVFFTQGTGQHTIDFQTYEVVSGSVFFLNPGQVHCWSLSDDVQGHVFFHTQELFESEFLKTKLHDFPFYGLGQTYPVLYLDPISAQKITPLFETITKEYNSEQAYRMAKIASLIQLVYIDLARQHRDTENLQMHIHYAHIQRLQQLIEQHYKHKKMPRDYAEMMHMTTRHLSRICTDTLNTTPTDLILERILTEAKRMLIHLDASISSIAQELGYEDYSYFIRLFKKKVGMSPKEFQKQVGIIRK